MEIGISEARARLSELIRAVERGESVIITRRGRPVAQLLPPPAEQGKVRLGP